MANSDPRPPPNEASDQENAPVVTISDDSESEDAEFHQAEEQQQSAQIESVSLEPQASDPPTNPQPNQVQISRARLFTNALISNLSPGAVQQKALVLQEVLLNATTVQVTVVNHTNCILNIAFKTITPLAFENQVMPGQTFRKRIGKFWYTIEARVWTGNNNYNAIRDTVVPISIVVITAASFAASAVIRSMAIVTRAPAWVSRAMVAGRTLFTWGRSAAVLKGSTNIAKAIMTQAAIKDHGNRCFTDRNFVIKGGPDANVVIGDDGLPHLYMDITENFEGFSIEEALDVFGTS